MRKKVEADMLLQIMEQEGEVEQMRQSMVSPSDAMTAGLRRNTDFDTDALEALGQNDINEFLEDNQMPDLENQSQYSKRFSGASQMRSEYGQSVQPYDDQGHQSQMDIPMTDDE